MIIEPKQHCLFCWIALDEDDGDYINPDGNYRFCSACHLEWEVNQDGDILVWTSMDVNKEQEAKNVPHGCLFVARSVRVK